ncbi:MAG: glycosyltransferase [Gemmatales bacterium]|nr:glycosyltransferase [Gemmatales bacterium]MDW8176096.1 glycosyltransferase [Gemmatales bacterium]
MNAMRILVVTGNPYLASTTRPLDAALGVLSRQEVIPHFLFLRPGPWQQELVARGETVVVRSLSWPSKNNLMSSSLTISWLVAYLIRNRIDLIHCNEHEHYPAVRHAAHLARRPTLVTLHYNLEGSFGRWAFAAPYSPGVLQFLSRRQYELSKSDVPRYLESRTYVTGSGLSVSKLRSSATGRNLRKELGIDDNTVVLGTAGAIRPRKRLEDFVQLVAKLRQQNLPVVGLIAGGGKSLEKPYKESLDALVEKLNLRNFCRFIGFIYPCTDFYKALDIYVHTSSMEIFCMAMCEAQAMGVPCLAYDVGGNREAVPDESCLVPLGVVEALARKVAMLVRDTELRRTRGTLAARFVEEQLDAPVYASKVRKLYSLLREGKLVT